MPAALTSRVEPVIVRQDAAPAKSDTIVRGIYLTAAQVADRWGTTISAVYKRVRRDALTTVQIDGEMHIEISEVVLHEQARARVTGRRRVVAVSVHDAGDEHDGPDASDHEEAA